MTHIIVVNHCLLHFVSTKLKNIYFKFDIKIQKIEEQKILCYLLEYNYFDHIKVCIVLNIPHLGGNTKLCSIPLGLKASSKGCY